MKAVLIGDVHLADHPPSIRKESYLDEPGRPIMDNRRYAYDNG